MLRAVAPSRTRGSGFALVLFLLGTAIGGEPALADDLEDFEAYVKSRYCHRRPCFEAYAGMIKGYAISQEIRHIQGDPDRESRLSTLAQRARDKLRTDSIDAFDRGGDSLTARLHRKHFEDAEAFARIQLDAFLEALEGRADKSLVELTGVKPDSEPSFLSAFDNRSRADFLRDEIDQALADKHCVCGAWERPSAGSAAVPVRTVIECSGDGTFRLLGGEPRKSCDRAPGADHRGLRRTLWIHTREDPRAVRVCRRAGVQER